MRGLNTQLAADRKQLHKTLTDRAAAFSAKGGALLRQLRLGCLHPQLTRRWRERSHELQLTAVWAESCLVDGVGRAAAKTHSFIGALWSVHETVDELAGNEISCGTK